MLAKNIKINSNIFSNMKIINDDLNKGVTWKKKLTKKIIKKTNKDNTIVEYENYAIQIDKPLQDYLDLTNNEICICFSKDDGYVLSNHIIDGSEKVYQKIMHNTFKHSDSATLALPKAIVPKGAENAIILLDMMKNKVFLRFS